MPPRMRGRKPLLACLVLIVAAACAPAAAPTPRPAPGFIGLQSQPSGPTLTPVPPATDTPTPTPVPSPTPSPSPTPTPTPTPLPSPTPPATDTPSAADATDEAQTGNCSERPAQSVIQGRRLVAYYGTPLGPGLGILGRVTMTDTLALLADQAAPYRELDPCAEVVLVFHMVTTVADGFAGPDGDYNHRVAHEIIQPWIDGVVAAGGLAVLDIQPGHADLGIELSLVESLLLQRGVHLAIDPEFMMSAGGVPGHRLGTTDGATINIVQAWLQEVAQRAEERKILIVHQFEDSMVTDKDLIEDYSLVDLVWDADGFGGPGAKTADYHQYRDEGGFEFGGFKLFYEFDHPVMTPLEVLALDPPPAYVIYQ